jgi:hypothetical protein
MRDKYKEHDWELQRKGNLVNKGYMSLTMWACKRCSVVDYSYSDVETPITRGEDLDCDEQIAFDIMDK